MPYTYLIGWSEFNIFYYGVRFAPTCHPSDLWTKYFTSSKKVKRFRYLHGEPDIIEVRKVFDTPEKARLWESVVLRRLNAPKSKKWLNQTDHNNRFYHEGPRGSFTEEHKAKMSATRKKQKMTPEHMKKLHEGRRNSGRNEAQINATIKTWTGRKHSEEAKLKMSVSAKLRGKRKLMGDT